MFSHRAILVLLIFGGSLSFIGLTQTKSAPLPPSPNRTAVLDFDGDGKADIAVYRRGGINNNSPFGIFYVWQSASNTIKIIQWGLSTDNGNLTQDFDGDGKADFTAVRCIANQPITWYILLSRSNYQQARVEQFGLCSALTQDAPIRGDFDGDGKADVAFYRRYELNPDGTQGLPSNRFYLKLSGKNRIQKIQFGAATLPNATTQYVNTGDFDGDGKTDMATSFLTNEGMYYRTCLQLVD